MIKPRSACDIATFMKKVIAEETRMPNPAIDENLSFHQFGLDSISSIYLLEKVENEYDITISPLYFWDYPTINLLAEQIFNENFRQI
ncbi:acyl carrier protein [Fulvivirga ulvae]|uniref:acyl carrier protein n=1 Tax=Fulvivirga ulvae TaxID=2904245 RepID=UPI001F35C219|nr:acyl carrier protein [Fulvivirga ulvae]UII31749.1 acyl carrier protein [Fulvivirga ulvae]